LYYAVEKSSQEYNHGTQNVVTTDRDNDNNYHCCDTGYASGGQTHSAFLRSVNSSTGPSNLLRPNSST
jgi:hypothetical protein